MKLNLLQINKEFTKSTYVGKISFSDLSKIARLTYRERDEKGEDNGLFQRMSDNKKISEISLFIKERLYKNNNISLNKDNIALFPTAIIISLNKIDEDSDDQIVKYEGGFLDFSSEDFYAFIIDGQHRYLGTQKFYEDTQLSYQGLDIEFPVTVLLGYDIYEQSKIFADVNFKQKPVNASLYYDIYGSDKNDRTEKTLAHFLVKHLNYTETSPFYKMIKMLGVGSGIISQSFLVEKISDLFKPKKAFSLFFDEYKNNGLNNQKKLAEVFTIYFNVIKNKFDKYYPVINNNNEYSSTNQSVLFKTTGVGALLRLLNDFGDEIKLNSENTEYLRNYFDSIFSLINASEAEDLFGKQSQFSKGGSGGLQLSLYRKLKDIIDYKKNVVGKVCDNAIILDIKKSKNANGGETNDILLSNNTTKRESNEWLEAVRLK